MKYTILIAAVIALAQAAPLINNGGKPIPDSYIVVLKNGNTAESFQTKFDDIARRQNGRGRKPTIHRKYEAVPGFAATVNAAALKELLAADEVEYVEQDAIITLSGSQTSPPSWGLPRVSQRDRVASAPYLYNDAAGSGVTAYVVDTGVYTAHSEFGGRATWGANFISGSANTDENGHGTHVAGTIGGTKYGVAKKVNIVGVKVLDAGGSGSTSGVVAGMDWVAARAVAGKSVVNMSLGGGKSTAINDAAARFLPTASSVFNKLTSTATLNKITGNLKGSPNRLVFNGAV
ncbi:subtilisin-like serine protease [Mortierella alpina]|nr:subtilisin-like serine protease [Mortierella alpina]